jgi:hypothetical protein
VLDIACGKARSRAHRQQYGCTGIGVNSPFAVDARARADQRVPGSWSSWNRMGRRSKRGRQLRSAMRGRSLTFGGRGPTAALASWCGRVDWWWPASSEVVAAWYPAASGAGRSHRATWRRRGAGLTPLYAVASSDDDRDRYCGLTWRAANAGRRRTRRPDRRLCSACVRRGPISDGSASCWLPHVEPLARARL